jgi:PKD domain
MVVTGRMVTLVTLALGIMACGGGTPTAPPSPAPPSASPAPVPTAAPPSPAPGNQPPAGTFLVNPDPPHGETPLQVRVNMCRSSDPDPADELRFSVDFGDGVSASGGCSLEHTYLSVGDFRARACVSDGQEGHTQCQAFTAKARPVNLPPDVSNLRVTPAGHSTSTVAFLVWDEHEPVAWVASVKAGTPGASAGCFQVLGGCFESVAGESKVGAVQVSYRDGIAGPTPGRNFVIITIRAVDPQGKTSEKSVEYNVF